MIELSLAILSLWVVYSATKKMKGRCKRDAGELGLDSPHSNALLWQRHHSYILSAHGPVGLCCISSVEAKPKPRLFLYRSRVLLLIASHSTTSNYLAGDIDEIWTEMKRGQWMGRPVPSMSDG